MASQRNLLRSELVTRSFGDVALGCSSTAYGYPRRRIVPTNCCISTRKRRSLVPKDVCFSRICKANSNGGTSWNSASGSPGVDVEKYRSRLESLLYCGKEIPEEAIEKPTGVPKKSLPIGSKPMCGRCEAKGAVRCPTCTGSGLYVDSILESQGIIVKVKCLGCGGTGSTMCPKCGGRGHSEI